MDAMMRDVLHRCPDAGIRIHYRLDGRWVDATEMSHELRISCLMYAYDVALLASSEGELQHLYDELQEVFRRDGMLISIEKTEAAAYRVWVTPETWLEPQVTHPDGTPVKENLAFKYLGQLKERRGARREVAARLQGPAEAWRLLKNKLFRCKRLPVELRLRLYEVLATSQLLSAAETIPLVPVSRLATREVPGLFLIALPVVINPFLSSRNRLASDVETPLRKSFPKLKSVKVITGINRLRVYVLQHY